jgi:hypothetical protein
LYWDARFLMSQMPLNGRPSEEDEEEEEATIDNART